MVVCFYPVDVVYVFSGRDGTVMHNPYETMQTLVVVIDLDAKISGGIS